MDTLQIQVLSGLGSRMRAVLGAIAWAKQRGMDVCICWPRQDKSEKLGEFPVWFSELFDSPLKEHRMDAPTINGRTWPLYPTQVDAKTWRCRTCDPATLGIHQFQLDHWPYLDLWRPAALVREQIAAVKWPTAQKVVGVHIRCALAQSTTPPLEWFLMRMRNLRADFPNVRFFLSTDAREIEDLIKAEFHDIFCQERTYVYDRLGIARAAADLFLLQRCDWMIGSYNSSYSELAGWMRGGKYMPGWGRERWMPGGSYEDSCTLPVGLAEALS